MKIIYRLALLPLMSLTLADGAPLEASRHLAETFTEPPAESRITSYSRWTNGFVTREGIHAEMRAMAEMGFYEVTGDDCQEHHVPYERGPARPMTEAWDQRTLDFIRAGHELGIKTAVHICPGFATSGGPWITPDTAMRFVVAAETTHQGPGRLANPLPLPAAHGDDYREIAVLAFPSQEPRWLSVEGARVTTSSGIDARLDQLPEGELLPRPQGKTSPFAVIEADQAFTARSLIVEARGGLAIEIEASDNGEDWRRIGIYRDHSNGKERRKPVLSPLRIALEPTTARFFRVQVHHAARPVTALDLSAAPTLADYPGKSMAIHRYEFVPQALDAPGAAMAINPASIIDVSAHLQPDGSLSWEAPAGQWTLVRFGSVNSSAGNHPAVEGRGLECDKFSREAVKLQFDAWAGRIADLCVADGIKPFDLLHADSYEAGAQNWTPRMREEFATRRGYDLTPWLLTFTGRIVGDLDHSNRALRDFRRTAADLIADNYFGYLRELCHARGIKLHAQTYGNVWGETWDTLQMAGRVDYVQCEFWGDQWRTRDGYQTIARVIGIPDSAHVYGVKVASAEAWTSGMNYALSPRDYKVRGDLAMTRGVNQMSFHGGAHQPWPTVRPGMVAQVYGAGFHLTRAWWPLARPWFDYLSRCQHLLQQGNHVADVLYLYGEGAPLRLNTRLPEMPAGIAMDACPAEIVFERLRVDAATGDLVLPQGQRYRLLLLPPDATMTPAMAAKVAELVRAGATVAGAKPSGSQTLSADPDAADAEVRAIADALWGDSSEPVRKVGRGCVVASWDLDAINALWASGEVKARSAQLLPVAGLDAALAAAGITPDLTGTAGDHDIAFIHKSTPEAELYFLANATGQSTERTLSFRQSGRAPELWDPINGSRHALDFREVDGRTELDLSFSEQQSLFVVFPQEPTVTEPIVTESSEPAPATAFDPISLGGPWTVTFEKNLGAPESIPLDTLSSLTEHESFGVKHFSGIATYRRVFDLKGSQISDGKSQILLDLGQVHDIARVTLNGALVGTDWSPPYQLTVPTGLLRPGENELTIEVAIPWHNRMIGDETLPPDVAFNSFRGGKIMTAVPDWVTSGETSPNGRITFSSYIPGNVVNGQLEPSGLLGPVTLQPLQQP